jgi:cobalt-zinc-cadmium efflux system outer membrane protein
MHSSLSLFRLCPLLGLLLPLVTRAEPTAESVAPVSLPALVDEISTHNPELKFYEAEIAAAKAGARSASSLSAPELALDLGHKRVRDANGLALGDGAAWSVSVTQTFDWPGRLALRKAIANRDVALAELGLARFQNALASRARLLGYSLHAAAEQAAAVREVADRFAALKETFLAREPAGVTPLLETRVIEASELALQRRASEAELSLQTALIELNQLRGVAPGASLRVTPAVLQFSEAPGIDALLAAAVEHNFVYRMKQLELEQQGYAVQLARNERYPSVSVSPYFSSAKAGDRETIAGIGLSIPLPVTGRARGTADVAGARQRQAETAAVLARRELERDVLVAATTFSTKLAESRRWAPDAARKFREAAELADRHYRLGAVPIATYVELQTSYLDAVESLLATQREALEAGLKLQQLTGLDLQAAEVAP